MSTTDDDQPGREPRPPRMIRVYPPTKGAFPCRDGRCKAPIWFARTVASGSTMPFDLPMTPAGKGRDHDGKEIWLVPDSQVHWANCPGSSKFRERNRK
jgi:hypothetical protein